jgi:hypothetical protein
MERREVLASIGVLGSASSVPFSGCLSTTCEPREKDTPLGNVDLDYDGEVSFRAAVVGIIDEDKLVVDDTTGKAKLYTGLNYEIDTDLVEIGDCVTGEGTVSSGSSWDNRMPTVSLRERSFESAGSASRDVESVSEKPDTVFDVSFDSDRNSCETDVTLTHQGDEPVPADELLVVHRPDPRSDTYRGEDEVEMWWHEIDETKEADDELVEGDSATLTVKGERDGVLVWVSDWSDELKGWGTSGGFRC